MKDDIIIEVRGGLVQAVYSDNPNNTVRILDWDNIDSENMTDAEKQMENETKNMRDVF